MDQDLIEQQNRIIEKMEELGYPSHEIDEVVATLDRIVKEASPHEGVDASVVEIKRQILNEKDWRKRASLAAFLISREL